MRPIRFPAGASLADGRARSGRLAGVGVPGGWLAGLVLVLATAAVGCATDSPAASEGAAASEVRVGLIDYEITTPSVAVRPGPATLEVTNAGRTAHDLRVAGEETDAYLATLEPGESDTIDVDVAAGEDQLTLWCTLPGHRQQGMETTLPVAGSADG